MKKLIVDISYDNDVENPLNDGWKVYSFNPRHVNYKDESEVLPPNLGLRAKLKAGTAFILSYYEHGSGMWMLKDSYEWQTCPDKGWDGTSIAGIMIWEDDIKSLGPKNRPARAEDAKNTLSVYNDWCNGACYQYEIKTPEGEELQSIGGFVGEEHVVDDIAETIVSLKGEEDLELEVTGDAAWIAKYHDLQKRKVVEEKKGSRIGNIDWRD